MNYTPVYASANYRPSYSNKKEHFVPSYSSSYNNENINEEKKKEKNASVKSNGYMQKCE